MIARILSLGLVCLFVLSFTVAAPAAEKPAGEKSKDEVKNQNSPPDEAVGFVGKLEGTFSSGKKNGNALTITVTAATPADGSKAKDATVIVGKEVPVTVRWEKKDGKYSPLEADTSFVKGLKKGDAVLLEVNYVDSLKVIRMTAAPAKAEAKPEAK